MFDYSTLSPSTPVIIYADATKRDPVLGYITRVKSQGVNCLAFFDDGSTMMRLDCWHIADDRIRSRPELYREVAETEDRGVFDIAPAEVERRALLAQLRTLDIGAVSKLLASAPESAEAAAATAKETEQLRRDVGKLQTEVQKLSQRVKELSDGRGRAS